MIYAMNDYRNYQRNHHYKYFKKWNEANSYKSFKKNGKHLSKMQYAQQETDKYFKIENSKHGMSQEYFDIKSSLNTIQTNAVRRTCKRKGHLRNTNNSNFDKDKELASLVSKIYNFYSKNNFLQRLDFDIWRYIINVKYLYPYEIFGTILLLNKYFNKLFDKTWLIKILANKDALIIYYEGLIKHCQHILSLGGIECNCNSCFKHSESMIEIINDLFEMDTKLQITSRLMNASISKILANDKFNKNNFNERVSKNKTINELQDNHNDSNRNPTEKKNSFKYNYCHNYSGNSYNGVTLDNISYEYDVENVNMLQLSARELNRGLYKHLMAAFYRRRATDRSLNSKTIILTGFADNTCHDDTCNYDSFLQSIGMKCGYEFEYSSLCNCNNFHDWLHYHCNAPYRSCIIKSILSSKLICMELKKIIKVPETQLAGIMISMDTIPKVRYLKCGKCVPESRYMSSDPETWSMDYCANSTVKKRMKVNKFEKKNNVNDHDVDNDWFRYDDEIEYNKMIKKNLHRYKHLFDTMFLFTLLYYPPMIKHLLIVKTPKLTNNICIFSESIWKKWDHYKYYMRMFKINSPKNYHLRNTNATRNLKIDFVDDGYNLNIHLRKHADGHIQIHLR